MDNQQRVLILAPRLPYPVIGGDKLRLYNICKHLADKKRSLTLLSFVTDFREKDVALSHPDGKIFDKIVPVILPTKTSYWSTVKGLFNTDPFQINYYHSPAMQEAVDKELASGEYEYALAHLIRMAPYLKGTTIKKVLEMTDAISLNYKRNSNFKSANLLSFIYKLEYKRVLKYEIEAIREFDSVVVVSDVDRDYLKKHSDINFHDKIVTIPNGVSSDFLVQHTSSTNPNKVIFIGNLRSFQNSDGILHFIKETWPLIISEKPEAELTVIGASPSKQLLSYDGTNNIRITGEVESVKAEAEDAAVSVAPIRIGAGIQNKVLESMALEIPVVSTSLAAEGIDGILDGESVLLADDSSEFAESVLSLLNDQEQRKSIAATAKKVILDQYSWDQKLKGFDYI